jgi:hypothetical protein
LQDIWVKAAAFQDDTGAVSVITTADLVGLDTTTVETVSRRVREKFNVPRERLLFNYSHNHSCPVTGDVLHLYYPLMDAQQRAAVARYTARLYDHYVEVIGKAIQAQSARDARVRTGACGFRGKPAARAARRAGAAWSGGSRRAGDGGAG